MSFRTNVRNLVRRVHSSKPIDFSHSFEMTEKAMGGQVLPKYLAYKKRGKKWAKKKTKRQLKKL